MRSGDRSSRGVPEQGRRIDQTPKRGAADGPCVATMTSLNLPERMNELSEGVIRPFNATRAGRRGSILEIPARIARGHSRALRLKWLDRALTAEGGPQGVTELADGWRRHEAGTDEAGREEPGRRC